MAKRITQERVKRWSKIAGYTGATAIGILVLAFYLGAIDITGYSGDTLCSGTIEAPCYVYINFTANEDIFVYPSDNWSKTGFDLDPQPKEVRMYRSWGSGWREFKLNQSCTGTWCGLSNKDDSRKFSFAFREGKSYKIRYAVIKQFPEQDIKWEFIANE